MRVYIINGHVTRNNPDDISNHSYFIGYEATTGVILYWNIGHKFFIHRYHHSWFDKYNHPLSIEDNQRVPYENVHKNNIISPTLFNLYVDNVVRDWPSMTVDDELVAHERLGLLVMQFMGIFYADGVLVGLQDPEWLQISLNFFIVLF